MDVVKDLVAANRRDFERFDTNDGNGIDLAEVLALCAIWGKRQRIPRYDKKKIAASLPAADHSTTKAMVRELLAMSGSTPRDEMHSNQLAWRLNELFRKRFRARGQSFDMIIRKFLSLAGFPELDDESIKYKIKQGEKQAEDPLILRRLAKLERITGTPTAV